MSGLSLMKTRNLIDRLGDLDEEVTRMCKTGRTVSKSAPKGHSDEVSRLKTAMTAAEDCQVHLRMAKNALLEFDGFLQAQRPSLRQALMHPNLGGKTAGFIDQVGRKVAPAMEHHVGGLAEEAVECVGKIQSSLQALRTAEETDERSDDAKLSCKALEKTLTAAEKAIDKAIKFSSAPAEHGYEHMHASGDEEVIEEEMVEEAEKAKKATTHGYNIIAVSSKCKDLMEKVVGDDKGDDEGIEASDKKAGKMPPQFAENAQKKKDEAAAKKEEDDGEKDACNKSAHGYDLMAGELPDFIKEKVEEREGKKDDKEDEKSDKKAALPPEFLENAQKKKDEAKAKKEEDEKSDKKAAHRLGYEFEQVVPEHGYQITAPSEHGYKLTT